MKQSSSALFLVVVGTPRIGRNWTKMKRGWLLATLLLVGCGGPPKSVPMDGPATAQEIVDAKCASSAHLVGDFNFHYARRLLEDERYAELDALLDRLEKTDSIETLCSPTSLVLRLADVQKEADGLPWMVYYAGRWARENSRGWARLAAVVALTHRGDTLMNACGQKHYPLWEQGQGLFQQGTSFAMKGNSQTKGWPYLDFIIRLSKDSQAIVSSIRSHPEEVALYQALGNIWWGRTREQKMEILKQLEAIGPSSYALFFTMHLSVAEKGKINGEGWKWADLKTGFDELLSKHPKAVGVRNAYAMAGDLFADPAVVQEQMAILGWQWDPYYWGTLAKYQTVRGQLPDYHAAQSQCPSPAPDAEAVKHATREAISAEGLDLYEKQQWDTLDSLATKAPERWRNILFATLEGPAQEHPMSYSQREVGLKAWQNQRPDSPFMMSCIGSFYVGYAWLARGSGYANTVTPEGAKVFEERLEKGEKFIQAASREGPRDAGVLATLMSYHLAKSPNREAVDKLALEAAKKGRFGFPALAAYATYLLPRWHGQPGDLVRAADQLRRQTGNDDAYAAMALTAMVYEGYYAFEPGHPAGLNWERWSASLEAAGKAGRANSAGAFQFLEYANTSKRLELARRVAPYVPIDSDEPDDRSRPEFHAVRRWGLGQADSPWAPNPIKYDGSTARKQSAKKLPRMGFRAHLDHPPPLGAHFVLEVDCPPLRADDGTMYKRFTVFMDILPGDSGETVNCYLEGTRPDDFVPGVYNIALLQNHKALHEEKFELNP